MVDAALRAAGHRSARYTSPHLVDLSERFVIDGRPVGERRWSPPSPTFATRSDALLRGRHAARRSRRSSRSRPPSAFELFRRAGVESRCSRSASAAGSTPPTSSHAGRDGDHVDRVRSPALPRHRRSREIAFEKAGIIKPGVPVVVGRSAARRASAVIERGRARARRARSCATAAARRRRRLRRSASRGAHQTVERGGRGRAARHRSTRSGIAVPRAGGRARPRAADWPGRLERAAACPDGREVLLDAAHNPAGAAALASYLTSAGRRPRPLVFAAMRDKDVAGMFAALLPAVSRLMLTRASNRALGRSVDAGSAGARDRADLPITIEPSAARRARRSPGARRRASSSPDRFSCSATS